MQTPTREELAELLRYMTPEELAEVDELLTPDNEVFWCPSDPVRWIERELFIPETNAPIILMPYQRAIIRKALTRGAKGNLPYSLVLWSDIKKSAKSVIAAGVVLWLAWHTPWETCRVVGNDLKQASSRTFYYIQRAVQLNPRLRARIKDKLYKLDLPNHTSIEAIAVDPKGEAGGGDLIVCFTELWAAKAEAAKQLWTETTLSPLKYGKSIRWCESYAGFVGESPILEQLYATGVTGGDVVDVGIEGLELYENAPARFLCLWNTKPRCDWQTAEYYAQEAAVLAPDEFDRIHRNIWASATNKFLPIEWWDGCKGDMPALEPGEPLVVGLDAAVTHDCFAVVAVSRRGDTCYVRYVNVWAPPPHGVIDFRLPEAEVRRLAREYNVVCFTYDPTQLADMAQRLTDDGVGWLDPFNQGAGRLIADKELYDRIAARRIRHDGDPVLREHIQNSDAKTDPELHTLRIVHRTPELPMDAAVALSQACRIATLLNIG